MQQSGVIERLDDKGRRHSVNGLPAFEVDENVEGGAGGWPRGTKLWFKHGELHRDGDLPAIVYPGYQAWYQDGKQHRDGDQPAAIWEDALMVWCCHGVLHRVNGPALVWSVYTHRPPEWYLHGVKIQSP
jgi:hypothetical protein